MNIIPIPIPIFWKIPIYQYQYNYTDYRSSPIYVTNLLKLNFFFGTRLLGPKNFSERDQVDYLTVENLESSWNLEHLELECGPAQPNLFENVWLNKQFSFPYSQIPRECFKQELILSTCCFFLWSIKSLFYDTWCN